MTHICVSKLTIIGSDNGFSPGRRQAIIWANDGILLIRTFQTHFSEIASEIHTFSFKKMHFKMSSGKWRPSCLGLNELTSMSDRARYSFLSCSHITNLLPSVSRRRSVFLDLELLMKSLFFLLKVHDEVKILLGYWNNKHKFTYLSLVSIVAADDLEMQGTRPRHFTT